MRLTRRAFLKLATGFPFLDLAQFMTPTAPAVAPSRQTGALGHPWVFPLQLPAYFVMVSPRKAHSQPHNVYLPSAGK